MMGEGSLSQDEIEALLKSTDTVSNLGFGPEISGVDTGEGVLTEVDRSTLTEIFRNVVQSALNIISSLTGREAGFSSINIDTFELGKLSSEILGELLDAKFMMSGNISGEFHFIYPAKSVLAIANPALGDESNRDITDLVFTTFSDIVSQLIGNFVSVISESTGKTVTGGVPSLQKFPNPSYIPFPKVPLVRVSYNLNVGNEIGKVYVVFPQSTAKQIVMSYSARRMPDTAQRERRSQLTSQERSGKYPVKPVEFSPLEEVGVDSESGLSVILDVPVQITVELGRTKMLVKEVLQLGEGSIVELDKLAGEPVDVLVNGRLIAKGEVVVIEENFGVRVTEIVNHIDRMFKYVDRG